MFSDHLVYGTFGYGDISNLSSYYDENENRILGVDREEVMKQDNFYDQYLEE